MIVNPLMAIVPPSISNTRLALLPLMVTPPTLLASIQSLIDEFPADTTVYPGHMGVTTLGTELATNPFLRELAA